MNSGYEEKRKRMVSWRGFRMKREFFYFNMGKTGVGFFGL